MQSSIMNQPLLKPRQNFINRMSAAFVILLLASFPHSALAQSEHLSPGWVLDPANSSLEFETTKTSARGVKTETSTFATVEGQIDGNGNANITYFLDSVDTNIDLRNVRMRFLFFETYINPYLHISTQLEPAMLTQLAAARDITIEMPITFSLNGISGTKNILVQVQLLDDNTVNISSVNPVAISIADIDLMDGLLKLEEAATVSIVPETQVSVNFRFNRAASTNAFVLAIADFVPVNNEGVVVASATPAEVGVAEAIETEGEFSVAECQGRFEILSRTDSITFGTNLAALTPTSYPLLDSIVDIVNRCPSLIVIVAGHTDSVGDSGYNLFLSEQRAASVVSYLEQNGVDPKKIQSVGYGEARPAFANTTRENRRRNRRIEFFSLQG